VRYFRGLYFEATSGRGGVEISYLMSTRKVPAAVALVCSLGRDIISFGKAGEDAATKEIRQILDTEALIPTRKPK